MAIVLRRKDNESTASFLRRFKTKLTQSGLIVEAKKHSFLGEESNERGQKLSKIYRLKIRKYVERLMKDGIDFETALARARNYAKHIKYHGK